MIVIYPSWERHWSASLMGVLGHLLIIRVNNRRAGCNGPPFRDMFFDVQGVGGAGRHIIPVIKLVIVFSSRIRIFPYIIFLS